MKANIGIPEKNIDEIVTLLNVLLADEYSLYTKTRNAHWNVTGDFFGLQMFFESQHKKLDIMIDDIAERVRSLGHFALGSLNAFMSATHLKDGKKEISDSKQIIKTLVNDHELIIRGIRDNITPITEKYKDYGTADFITELMEKHEKMAWMLRSYLT